MKTTQVIVIGALNVLSNTPLAAAEKLAAPATEGTRTAKKPAATDKEKTSAAAKDALSRKKPFSRTAEKKGITLNLCDQQE